MVCFLKVMVGVLKPRGCKILQSVSNLHFLFKCVLMLDGQVHKTELTALLILSFLKRSLILFTRVFEWNRSFSVCLFVYTTTALVPSETKGFWIIFQCRGFCWNPLQSCEIICKRQLAVKSFSAPTATINGREQSNFCATFSAWRRKTNKTLGPKDCSCIHQFGYSWDWEWLRKG